MKGSTIIKIVVVVAAIGVVGYVIHHSNRAAEITELVKSSPEEFNLNQHVDSMITKIENTSSAQTAYDMYNDLYEEIDVYAHITKTDGSTLIRPSDSQTAYEHAFSAYWPFIKHRADSMFNCSNWSAREDIKKEVSLLLERQGLTPECEDSLKHYNQYISGYGDFASLLKQLEKCKNAQTYRKHSKLDNYTKYPYCNLSQFQERRKDAKDKAKESWKEYLMSRKEDILQTGGKSEPISDDVTNFIELQREWERDVESYENTTDDRESFRFAIDELEETYRTLARRVNKNKKSK